MKTKKTLCYLGLIFSALLIILLFITDFPQMVDIALSLLFAIVFSVSQVQLLHEKMLATDNDYRLEIMDERHISIKEKAGNITNMINLSLMGCVTIVFIAMDFVIPAVIMGILIFIQPILLIFVSNKIEKQM